MKERLENTGLHTYEIHRSTCVYEKVEMVGAHSMLGLNEKLRQNFSRNA
jgi:hypothetical protein